MYKQKRTVNTSNTGKEEETKTQTRQKTEERG
jgi:hypothetical protein